jgi:hypothetical protein
MGFQGYIAQNWFDLLQSAVILAGLIFTGLSYRRDTKSRDLENFFRINEAHRDIWTEVYRRPELDRVLSTELDLENDKMTDEEAVFVNLLILHLNATFRAMRSGLYTTKQGIEEDIRWFFSLPIPRSVWHLSKQIREPDFVEFVENALRRAHGRKAVTICSPELPPPATATRRRTRNSEHARHAPHCVPNLET